MTAGDVRAGASGFFAHPLVRHASNMIVILTVIYFVGKPHAEQFVIDAVDDRISAVEQGVSGVRQQVGAINAEIDRQTQTIDKLSRDLEILKQSQALIQRKLDALLDGQNSDVPIPPDPRR